ncbi:Malonate--CoA ligase [Bienertia sinuspersici]
MLIEIRSTTTKVTTLILTLDWWGALSSSSFMEVVKAVASQGAAANNSIAVRADSKSYSYSELIESAKRISNLLRTSGSESISQGQQHENSSVSVDGFKASGAVDGTRVGIVAKPSAEFVASVLGTWLSGGVAVPLALSYPEAELLHVMHDSDVSIVLSTEDHQELMQTVASKSAAQFSLIPKVSSVTSESTTIGHCETEQSDLEASLKALEVSTKFEEEDAALIIYTSGTTGKPKGAVHTHRSVLAQAPRVSGIWQRWRESYPMDGAKADSAVTVFTGVPTMYSRLIQGYEAMDPDVQSLSASAASKLRLMMSGSSALPYPVMQQWEKITGHRLLERYGMTEFIMAMSNPLQGMRKGGTVGKPFPGIQVKILAEDVSGNETGSGELCVTKQSFTDDGFFKTGDAVTVDEDGYYIILGRTSADIMKVGGYKLSALEIEAILLEHPAVSECCVLGVPDKTYGEVVTAIIVPHEEVKIKQQEELKPALTLEELCSSAKDKLAPYKLPTQLYLWDSLPRNAMGKVNKKELKKKLVAEGQ